MCDPVLFPPCRATRPAVGKSAAAMLQAACWIFLTLGAAGTGRADVFELTNGARLTGKLLNPEESPRRVYRIELTSGAVVELAKDQVHQVQRMPATLASYRRAARRMPDTLEAHLKMAQLCADAKLTEERRFHFEQVLRFDSENETARRGLGYVRIGKRWVMPEERFRQMGYVKHKGKWKLPQDIELETVKERRRQEEVAWRQKLRRWRTALLRGKPEARQQALLDLQNARSPFLVPAITRLLEQGKEPKALRRLYVDVLANLLPDQGAAQVLARIVLEERDPDLVEAALTQLERRDGARYAWIFVPALKSPDNATINRAARALGRLGNPSVVPDLIDALVTKHRKRTGGPGLNIGQGPGTAGLSTGPGAKVIEYPVKNPDVLTALTLLTSENVNFDYDKSRWRSWYARQKMPQRYDLRRDE